MTSLCLACSCHVGRRSFVSSPQVQEELGRKGRGKRRMHLACKDTRPPGGLTGTWEHQRLRGERRVQDRVPHGPPPRLPEVRGGEVRHGNQGQLHPTQNLGNPLLEGWACGDRGGAGRAPPRQLQPTAPFAASLGGRTILGKQTHAASLGKPQGNGTRLPEDARLEFTSWLVWLVRTWK